MSWLSDRLTPVRKTVQMWVDLALSIEQFFEEEFFERAEWMKNLRSVYTTDSEGLQLILSEKGTFFNSGEWPDSEKAVALAMRKFSLLHKDRALIIGLTLRYAFQGLVASWKPLYARKTDTYGSVFYTLEEADFEGIDISELFLTSRGLVAVDNTQLGDMGYTLETFQAALDKEMAKILPLHVVFDGLTINNDSYDLACGTYSGVCITRETVLDMRS